MNDCIFCKIVKGEIPSYKIYEDDEYLAFLDIFPAVEGYTLVIPKKHYRWVWDVENIGRYFDVCQKISKHFQKVTKDEKIFSMIIGEEVPHAHIRIIPGNDNEFNQKLYTFIQDTQKPEKLDGTKAQEILNKFKL
jgi:histidine triad (HIT) family protein